MAFVEKNKEKILQVIDGWTGKLSYELLGERLRRELGLNKAPSRYIWAKHHEIKEAFDLKKEALRAKKSEAIEDAKLLFESTDKLSELVSHLGNDDATIAELIKQIEKIEQENERLSAENKRLKHTNDILLERFARWQHNLQKMNNVDLNRLMDTIDDGLPAKFT